MITDGLKRCPNCGDPLEQGHKSGLTTWQCPAAHGVGIHLVEAYGHLQRDELEKIWEGAQQAPRSNLRSPLSGKPMVEVTFPVDDDTAFADGSDSRTMTVEVDVDNYFGWFSFAELRAMPSDSTRRGPSAPGLVGLQQMDEEADEYDEFFDNLSPDDFVEEEEPEPAGINGFLGGLARRLRS